MGKKCFYIHCNLSLIFHYQFFRISPGLAPKFIWQNSVRYDCDTNPHTSATSSSGKSVCVSRFFTLSFRSPFSHSWGVVRNSSRNSRRKVLRLYPQRSARCPDILCLHVVLRNLLHEPFILHHSQIHLCLQQLFTRHFLYLCTGNRYFQFRCTFR